MNQRYRKALKHPVETAMTAPYGSLLSGVGLSGIALFGANTFETSTTGHPVGAALNGIFAIVSLFNTKLGMQQVGRQLYVREHLEASIERHGYNERIFTPLTDEWCTRQTAYRVAKQNDFIEEYRQLCTQRADTAELPRLPNF